MTNETMANSWDEFYESYDGKFDERYMLHITVHARYKNEIENLGYKLQNQEDDWHKPIEGEYKLDDDGNLILIHSCPDREIFNVYINEFLEDLMLNEAWVSDIDLSTM
tara:strand:+ start:77 stop:400 length:324 start_codon:yes stop_codon:yes gene_type:complete